MIYSRNNLSKREILLLVADANTGKTTSICLLYNELLNARRRFNLNKELIVPQPNGKYPDFQDTLDMNGIIVGFASAGDSRKQIEQNCAFFLREKCDKCVTASSVTGGKTRIIRFARSNQYGLFCLDYAFFNPQFYKSANREKVDIMLTRMQ